MYKLAAKFRKMMHSNKHTSTRSYKRHKPNFTYFSFRPFQRLLHYILGSEHKHCRYMKVGKGAKIRNRYNQVPHLTKDAIGKVTYSQLDTTNESQEVSPFPAGDHKAHISRRSQRHSKHKTEKTIKVHKRSTVLKRSVKYSTGGLKPV